MIGTKIFQFGHLEAEKFAFKNFKLHFCTLIYWLILMQFYPRFFFMKLGFVLESSRTFNLQ